MLHDYGKHVVLTLGPGLPADDPENLYYNAAAGFKALIRSSIHPKEYDGNLVTRTWTSQTAFLDYFNEKAALLWRAGLENLKF